jgi:hypothetical protein
LITDEKKQDWFLYGLNDGLAYALEAHDFVNFQAMVDKAIVLENRRGIMEWKRKIQTGYNLSVAPQNRCKDEDGMGHTSRSSGLLRVEENCAWVSQSTHTSRGRKLHQPQDWWRRSMDGARGIITEVVWRSS